MAVSDPECREYKWKNKFPVSAGGEASHAGCRSEGRRSAWASDPPSTTSVKNKRIVALTFTRHLSVCPDGSGQRPERVAGRVVAGSPGNTSDSVSIFQVFYISSPVPHGSGLSSGLPRCGRLGTLAACGQGLGWGGRSRQRRPRRLDLPMPRTAPARRLLENAQ